MGMDNHLKNNNKKNRTQNNHFTDLPIEFNPHLQILRGKQINQKIEKYRSNQYKKYTFFSKEPNYIREN